MASLTVIHKEAAWEACTTAGYSNVFGEKTRMTSSFFSLAPLRKPCASRLLKLRSSPNLSKRMSVPGLIVSTRLTSLFCQLDHRYK